MTAEHTPGPWSVDPLNPTRVVFKFRNGNHTLVQVPVLPNNRSYNEGRYALDIMAEQRANARLIAAAPEMLEALEIMVRAFNTKDIDPLVAFASIEKAKHILAKAKGGNQ